jgi:hypothetical protein
MLGGTSHAWDQARIKLDEAYLNLLALSSGEASLIKPELVKRNYQLAMEGLDDPQVAYQVMCIERSNQCWDEALYAARMALFLTNSQYEKNKEKYDLLRAKTHYAIGQMRLWLYAKPTYKQLLKTFSQFSRAQSYAIPSLREMGVAVLPAHIEVEMKKSFSLYCQHQSEAEKKLKMEVFRYDISSVAFANGMVKTHFQLMRNFVNDEGGSGDCLKYKDPRLPKQFKR